MKLKTDRAQESIFEPEALADLGPENWGKRIGIRSRDKTIG